MNYTLYVRPEAEQDISEITAWYRTKRARLAVDFQSRLEETFARIEHNPFLCAAIDGDIRRARVRRFPYGVFFRVLNDRVVVLGVFHNSRDPWVWKSRG